MDGGKTCRICAAKKVKMYDLHTHPWKNYFETVTGINPLMDVSHYACYHCAALLKKYYLFRQRCLNGQTALYEYFPSSEEVINDTINEGHSLHMDKALISFNLSIHNVPPENIYEYVYDDYEGVKVKEELTDLMDIDTSLHTDVKLEDDYISLPSLLGQSTDDDEPLSLHQTDRPQNKTKKKKTGKGRKENFNADEELMEAKCELKQTFDDCAEEEKAEIKEAIEPKIKKKRGPKTDPSGLTRDEMEMEEYVTIVKLSEEEQKDEINQRKNTSNYKHSPYRCEVCYKGFVDSVAFRHHMTKHDSATGDVECPVCRFRFASRRALQKHAVNHEKKYACKTCDYISKTTTQAKQHHKWHKGVTYKCQYCEEILSKWTSYLSHVRIKHPSEFICGVCGYSFVSRLGLAMHKTMMHKDVADSKESPTEVVHHCKDCDVQFTSLEAWKRHLVTSAKHTHNNDFANGCRVCGETFKSSEELRVHHRREHARKRPKNYGKKPSDTVWPVKCEHRNGDSDGLEVMNRTDWLDAAGTLRGSVHTSYECEEEIPNAREHWAHFRRLHPDKKYPINKSYICEICGKGFRGNAFLEYHRRTHFEERSYKCAQCPKSFFNRTNLQMHEKTHSDNRPYPCNICFKAFKLKGALDRHYRSHTGVKPYECEVCGKAFGQSNSRKLHVRTVHLKQPAPYISKSRMERRRATHGDKPAAPSAGAEHIAHAFSYPLS